MAARWQDASPRDLLDAACFVALRRPFAAKAWAMYATFGEDPEVRTQARYLQAALVGQPFPSDRANRPADPVYRLWMRLREVP